MDSSTVNAESESIEFKPSLSQIDKIIETISAFSNTKGGRIEIGKDDKDGSVLGITIGKRTVENLANDIKQNTDPPVYPSIKVAKADGKEVIVVSVEESKSKPVFAFGRAFKRVGKSNHKLSKDEIRKLMMESSKVYWDEQICEDAKWEDIDEGKVKWYLDMRSNVRKTPPELDMKTLLVNIGGAKEEDNEIKITNAGTLFFGKNPQRFVRTRLIGARFKGKEISRSTTDSIDCSGTIWEMLDQIENFIRKNVGLYGFRTSLNFRRIDKLEYPMEAVREGVINALLHREYSELIDTRVFIFDNRIEIINPGSFPEGVTAEKPIHKPRNPVLCQLMRDVGFTEKYGSGIYFMRKLCAEWGIPEPEFEITKLETKVVFKSGGEAVIIPEIGTAGVELNDRQKNALKYVFSKGSITTKGYQEINKVGRKTAYQELIDLLNKGLLSQEGRGRATRYLKGIT